MKKKLFYYAALCFAALMTAATFTACSDDDDDSENNGNNTPSKVKAEAVDLGLSVKWASCNVGASSPEDSGDHYAWGETEEKDVYSMSTYKYYHNGSYVNIGSNISGTNYDVAHMKWGRKWRMPTFEECMELRTKCTWKWTTQKGTAGYVVTGPNGNSIFLPTTGSYVEKTLSNKSVSGDYWTSTHHESFSNGAYTFTFTNGNIRISKSIHGLIYCGYSVRPVSR